MGKAEPPARGQVAFAGRCPTRVDKPLPIWFRPGRSSNAPAWVSAKTYYYCLLGNGSNRRQQSRRSLRSLRTGCTVGSEEELLLAGHGLVGGGGDVETRPPGCDVFRLLRRHDFKYVLMRLRDLSDSSGNCRPHESIIACTLSLGCLLMGTCLSKFSSTNSRTNI